MDDENHTLFADIGPDGEPDVDMASRRGPFLVAIDKGILEAEKHASSPGGDRETWDKLHGNLIKVRARVVDWTHDLNLPEATRTRKAAQEAEYRMHDFLTGLRRELEAIGSLFDIDDLHGFEKEGYYTVDGETLKERFAKSVREEFYTTDYGTAARAEHEEWKQAARDEATKRGFPDDRHWVCTCKLCGEEGRIFDSSTGVGEMTIHHEREVATHWNEEGRFQGQDEREAWYRIVANHKLVSKQCNSKMGGPNYNTKVGPDFSGKLGKDQGGDSPK